MIPPLLQAQGLAAVMNSAEFVLPLRDLGAGAVDTSLSRGTGSATFTRATTAWTKLSTGLWASVASGVARSCYIGLNTVASTAYGGYLAEGARTNEALWARDMTNAAWAKVTTTAALDQVGIDGVASSASSLTATAGNGTTLQIITEAAATREFSAFVRRITGTGEIDMTEDGGLTWTDITASINSSTYTQVAAAAQSVLNPSVGFRIVSSGDAIAVDMCQNETGAFASTPIPTTTVAVTRNADVLTYPFAGNALAAVGSAYVDLFALTGTPGTNLANISFANVAAVGPFYLFNSIPTTSSIYDGTTAVDKTGLSNITTGVRKRSSSWGSLGLAVTGDGAAPATGTFDGDLGSTGIGIGCRPDGSGGGYYVMQKAIRIWQRQLPNAVLQAITT